MTIDDHIVAREYVADLRDITDPAPELRVINDAQLAARMLEDAIRKRVDAALDGATSANILLSGGVDSIVVAAVAVEVARRCAWRPDALQALTINAPNSRDGERASHAASVLGLRHRVIDLTDRDVRALAVAAKAVLGTPELWEIAAAVPLLAAREHFNRGPTLTGSGADAILAGGKFLEHSLDSSDATAELDVLIRTEAGANFRRQRLVPDFYELLLPDSHTRHVDVFQTVALWELSSTFGPGALYGVRDGEVWDKYALRLACAVLTGDSSLAWVPKSPIQRSSGIFDSLVRCARDDAARAPGARTYTDPTTESLEQLVARLYLAAL